jgi:hypothetical protein
MIALFSSVFFIVTAFFAASGAAIAETLVVPGTANPWLAAMPDGSSANSGDFSPAQSPVLVSGIQLTPGNSLTFKVSGGVLNDPGCPPACNGPDGNSAIWHFADENGIANVKAPLNSLIGVFLDNAQPNTSSVPAALDFSTIGLSFASFSPALKQVFFIGDGLTGTGEGGVQRFVIPSGATRLFLGTMDGYGWHNNSGSFQAEVKDVGQAILTSPVLDQNLVSNGSFELPVVAKLSPGWLTVKSAQSFPGWRVTGNNSVDIHAGEYGVPWSNLPDGKQALDLNGSNAAGVSQDLATTPGATYTLRYFLSSNPACRSPGIQIQVLFDGKTVDEPVFQASGHQLRNMQWMLHEHTVVASSALSKLEFKSKTMKSSCGPAIDHVQVFPDAVPLQLAKPEPAIWTQGEWHPVNRGGCDGWDVLTTKLAVPIDELCVQEAAGKVVICAADHGGCFYKNRTVKQCNGGRIMGRMYVCGPK